MERKGRGLDGSKTRLLVERGHLLGSSRKNEKGEVGMDFDKCRLIIVEGVYLN